MMPENKRIIRTKAQWEKKFRDENKAIVRAVNDELETLNPTDYEALILEWTETAFQNQEKCVAEEAQAETDKAALLAKLGISADEAKLLLQ